MARAQFVMARAQFVMARLDRAISNNKMNRAMARSSRAMTAKRGTSLLRRHRIDANLV